MKRKKIFRVIVAIIATLTAVISCDKTPMNGPLDGQWQLMSIATPDGVRQTKAAQTYLCFQLHLTQWFRPDHQNVYAHFTHTADSIRFFDFVRASAQTSEGDNDEWITAREMNEGILDDWGVHSNDITYYVRQLSGSSLVLERSDTILTFRKF